MTILPNISTRCRICRMHINLCVCALMPHIEVQTRVEVLMHQKEFHIISNTGHLVEKVLTNAKTRFFGKMSREPMETEGLVEKERPTYLLYPYEDAEVLNEDFLARMHGPLTLIVPDGNWRQAAKMSRRLKFLEGIPKLKLPHEVRSNYRLRSTYREYGLCTYEAIMHAMRILESNEVYEKMDYFFNVFVERILWTRGKIKFHEVTGWEDKLQGEAD